MNPQMWLAASRAAQSEGKGAAVALLVIGFFLAPLLIGLPLMLLGAYKLAKAS